MFLKADAFNAWWETTNQFVTSGLNGVDWFFVLTGFLLAQPIFAGQRATGWGEFVWLRLSRIYPLYIFAVVLFCAGMQRMDTIPTLSWDLHSTSVLKPLIDEAIGGESLGLPTLCEKSWANLLFINNFLPFGGCMGWTWSLAIQVHFILIFPLLIKWFGTGRKFLTFCGVMTAVWMATRWAILTLAVQRYHIDPPPLYIWSTEYIEQFFVLFNIWYSSTFQRIGCCFAGVILAWIQVNKPVWTEVFHKNPICAWALSLSALYALKFSHNVLFANTVTTFLFSVGGIGHVTNICIILYCLINKLGPLQYLAPILSSKFFTNFAYPSYCVYLIHSYIILWLFRDGPFPPQDTYSDFALLRDFGLVLAVVYPISYLATRFIEEPIKGLMRDYIDPKPSSSSSIATPVTVADKKND